MFIHVGMLRVPTSVLISYLHQQLVHIIMCCELCQQLFSTFLILFSLFQRRLLKLIIFLLICCCRVQQPWILYTRPRQKSTTFSKLFLNRRNKQNPQLLLLKLWILHKCYLLNNSIAVFTLWIVSSLPIISIISVAPAGVICFPETAVLIGQSA